MAFIISAAFRSDPGGGTRAAISFRRSYATTRDSIMQIAATHPLLFAAESSSLCPATRQAIQSFSSQIIMQIMFLDSVTYNTNASRAKTASAVYTEEHDLINGIGGKRAVLEFNFIFCLQKHHSCRLSSA
jgi:hypothetical protein